MKKQDYILLFVLIGLLVAWPQIDRHIIKKYFFANQPQAARKEKVETVAPAVEPEIVSEQPAATPAPATEKTEAMAPAEEAPPSAEPEQTITIGNNNVELVLGGRGGGIREATLKKYPRTRLKDSEPMVLEFGERRALSYRDLPGLTSEFPFALHVSDDGRVADAERRAANGLRMKRTIELGDGYVLQIKDVIINESGAPLEVPASVIQVGPMHNLHAGKDSSGMIFLGVDTLSPGGEKVKHWGGKIAGLFKDEQAAKDLPKLPVTVDRSPEERPVDWISAKNKYFVQILTPDEGAESFNIYARREVTPRETQDPEYVPKVGLLTEVGSSMSFAAQSLSAGEALTNNFHYYIGPKKYSELYALRLHQVDVMEFGMWGVIGKFLLVILNFIHDHLWPYNYGLAIILLTVIIRVLFWPITHKSTESMKRMAEVQPLVTEIRTKYKDNPQKMQQEIMALYKAHKINPVGGCLPMLVQIPVFFALFVVLRSAIELRFASFLWIHDLSEPENLFAGMLPIPLNILPLLMAATMYWQQKLTPTAGDPAQAKMMRIMMPLMMLVFLYNFASGLALYWTTQNALMIVQQLVNLNKQKKKALAAAAKA